MKKRIFNIKCYVNEEREDTKLIKDIDKEEYTLEVGRKDANKDVYNGFNELKEKVLKEIRREYQDDNIEVRLI